MKINTTKKPKCYWITGLSAAGKTTLSKKLVKHLRDEGDTVVHLDGDVLRDILSVETYTRKERVKLGLTYSKLCKFLLSENISVVIGVIGLFKEIHQWNRDNIEGYIEIFLDTPMSELKSRDPKGLYQKFDSNLIKNVAGLDLSVDFPINPDISLKWSKGKDEYSMFDELLINLYRKNFVHRGVYKCK